MSVAYHGYSETNNPERLNEIARALDWDMRDIANTIPLEVKKAASGEVITLYENPDVGVLTSTYYGNFRFLITAQSIGYDGQLGWRKMFQQIYGFKLLDETDSTGTDLKNCPAPVELLGSTVRQLHDGYISNQGDQMAIHRANRMRRRGIHLPGIELIQGYEGHGTIKFPDEV